ncbi:MAG: hypothetical protein R3331_05315 [Sulfurospirillaceae bacterium]|nr:hypothetical protein [Sulfurospirillaceae bacterium]
MIFNLVAGTFTLVAVLLAIAKYRYENGISKFSPWHPDKKEEPTL